MFQEEKYNFYEKQGGKLKKAMQNKRTKQQEQMTPAELKGFRETEAARIKALQNRKEALLAKAMLEHC